jgi:hypothetical protein
MGRRVKGPIGGDAPYPTGMTGQDIFDTPIADLPPLTPAIRQAWGNGAHPVANAQSVAALFAGVYDLETRVTTLESGGAATASTELQSFH